MKPVVKPSFKRIFQLHPSAYYPNCLGLFSSPNEYRKSRIIPGLCNPFLSFYRLEKSGAMKRLGQQSVDVSFRIRPQVSWLLSSLLTKTWSKVVRTKMTTASTEVPYWRTPSLDNKGHLPLPRQVVPFGLTGGFQFRFWSNHSVAVYRDGFGGWCLPVPCTAGLAWYSGGPSLC